MNILPRYEGDSLPKQIYKKTLRINTEDVFPEDPESTFKQADHERIVVDQSAINYFELILWSAGIIFMLLPDWKKEKIEGIILGVIFIIFCLVLAINALSDSRKVFIFNRKEGTVTYPVFWFGSETVSFSDAVIIRSKWGFRSSIPTGLAFVSRNRRYRSFIHYDYTYAMLSFYVWYMDKNRPLPTGTAFDAYREADYLRRQSEGFPEPMYMSAIETPEWEGAATTYHDMHTAERGFLKYDPTLGLIACGEEGEIPDEGGLSY